MKTPSRPGAIEILPQALVPVVQPTELWERDDFATAIGRLDEAAKGKVRERFAERRSILSP